MRPLIFYSFSTRKIKYRGITIYFWLEKEKKDNDWWRLGKRDTGFLFLGGILRCWDGGARKSFRNRIRHKFCIFLFYEFFVVVVVGKMIFFFCRLLLLLAPEFSLSLFVIAGFDNRRHLRRRWQQTIHVGRIFFLGIVLLVFSSFFGWQGILYIKDLIALYLPIMLYSIQTWRVFFFSRDIVVRR